MSLVTNLAMNLARSAYDLGWSLAMPLLRRHGRLRQGFAQRCLDTPLPAVDLWVQAASGGEAYLAVELLRALEDLAPRLKALVTTNTTQGLAVLAKAAEETHGQGPELHVAYCPLDKPALMARALEQVRPKAVVLLESEMWPGLLAACRKQEVPVVLVNGRMRPRSLAGYLAAGRLMRALAPQEILAMSEADANRFGLLFGRERVSLMPNLKFDRLRLDEGIPYARNPLAFLLRPGAPFVVLGSVREEEEDLVEQVMAGLLLERPTTIIGLFPRHMERLDAWRERLERLEPGHPTQGASGPRWTLRSAMDRPAAPGTIVLWDTFGELGAAYHLARAAFVGGSLAPLGGQNFLEPLAAGLMPVIGPYWDNFAWVGTEIMDQGLAVVAHDPRETTQALVASLTRRISRDKVRARVQAYVSARCGGAKYAAQRIAKHLGTY